MGKKKLLFVFSAMYLGGAEISLLGLLDAIDTEKYDVDLFLFRHVGELMPVIPKKIRLLPEIKQYRAMVGPITAALRIGCPMVALGRLRGKWKAAKHIKKHQYQHGSGVRVDYGQRYTKAYLPKINPEVEYDLAISFITPHYVTTEKVCAKKKIAWIHTDYSVVDVDIQSQIEMWKPYEKIAAVSDQCGDTFVAKFPELSDRLIMIENLLSPSYVRDQSKAYIPDDMPKDGSIRILSIGRFSKQKNFDNVPDICSRIRSSGLDVKWYMIGFGSEEAYIREKIKEAGMEQYVFVLGKKENPYPYILSCDLYAQPSRYEGKAVAVREAQMLHKPVVITDFPTAKSQLEDGFDGLIVPMDNPGCAAGMVSLLQNSEKLRILSENTALRDYSNLSELQKLYSLI